MLNTKSGIMKLPDGWSSDYYKIPQGATELGDLIEHREMNFNVGNIFKACYRLGSKPGVSDIYDLKKILWFVERELKRVEKKAYDEQSDEIPYSGC